MGALLRVEFLRRKRYPHPDGPVRMAGEVLPIRGDLAVLWDRNGIVRLVEATPEAAQETSGAYEAARALADTSIVRLADAVTNVTDPAVLVAALEIDHRKTARPIYQAHLPREE